MARTAACGSARPSKLRSARSVARLTATVCTPGTALSARSTRPTHEAQVMPSTGRLRRVTTEPGGLAAGWRATEVIKPSLENLCMCEPKLEDSYDGKVNACGPHSAHTHHGAGSAPLASRAS